MSEADCDTLIVGAGLAGALVAYRLALKGQRVVLLDAGPRLERSDIIAAFRAAPRKNDFMAPYPSPPHAPQGEYVIQKGAMPFKAQYIRAVGGTTWHWAAIAWRFLPADFCMRSTYGVGRDWPIAYDDLEPYYQQAETELGVAGPDPAKEDLGSPRRAPYPMPAAPLSYMDREFANKLKAHGFRVVAEPAARNSVAYDERPACCGANNCMPICPTGALYCAAMHVAKAEAAGARLIENAVACHVETDAEGRLVTGLRYRRPDGSDARIIARRIVLAANGIETPKLMLISRSDALPQGVGNSSGQVGRNLMDHLNVGVSFLWDRPVFPGRGPQEMSAIVDYRDGPFRSSEAARKLHLVNMADLAGVTAALIEQGLSGPELERQIRHRVARRAAIDCFIEQLPDLENRIQASRTEMDILGIPRPEAVYSVDDYVRRGIKETLRSYRRIAAVLGATEVKLRASPSGSSHMMGTTIMGDDPRHAVVNRECRSHDHPNLFIAGSSVFASGGTVNPSLTIAALALRLADTITAGG
jgi:Choline dehydrogenase and related flavoproteins